MWSRLSLKRYAEKAGKANQAKSTKIAQVVVFIASPIIGRGKIFIPPARGRLQNYRREIQ